MQQPTLVVIGGVTYVCPPMPFYCLERAWPHIQRMSRLGALSQALAAAQLQVRNAITAEEHTTATDNLVTAQALVEQEGADFIGQTREAIKVIVAALALDTPPPSYEQFAKQVQPSEFAGIHVACTQLMNLSGLVSSEAGDPQGEASATGHVPAHLNGTGSSPN
jgi:hypothetical protein